ncbi:hypothetical protein TNCV_2322281 [Trichonephila clavipes]|nr:hypothetical protein TNCV_2322281 [Trichonephila clavipes]
MRLLTSIPKEDFLQSFQDMYSKPQLWEVTILKDSKFPVFLGGLVGTFKPFEYFMSYFLPSLDEDFGILKVKNWISITRRRAEWEKILRKAQAHKELPCQC